jgi:hypothetical protein
MYYEGMIFEVLIIASLQVIKVDKVKMQGLSSP